MDSKGLTASSVSARIIRRRLMARLQAFFENCISKARLLKKSLHSNWVVETSSQAWHWVAYRQTKSKVSQGNWKQSRTKINGGLWTWIASSTVLLKSLMYSSTQSLTLELQCSPCASQNTKPLLAWSSVLAFSTVQGHTAIHLTTHVTITGQTWNRWISISMVKPNLSPSNHGPTHLVEITSTYRHAQLPSLLEMTESRSRSWVTPSCETMSRHLTILITPSLLESTRTLRSRLTQARLESGYGWPFAS